MPRLFPRNEHTLDRVARTVAGGALIGLALAGPQILWLGAPGLVLLGTGLLGSCPIYTVLGVSSCRTRPART